MSTGTPALVVSMIAVVIAAGAATIALFALRTARAAHALNARRDDEERQRREANQQGHARFVTLGMSRRGSLAARITNGSPDPIAAVRIESVERVDRPELHTEPNPYYAHVRHEWSTIGPDEPQRYAVVLLDEHRQRAERAEDDIEGEWRITATWTDVHGQRWRRTGSTEPERIDG